MRCPSTLVDESERLQAVEEYGLNKSYSLSSLAPVVRLAAEMFHVPIAAVNLIGDRHVFFAASYGLEQACDMSRDVSFCAHAILQKEVMVVPDTANDIRFHDNPLVTGSPGVRFYAGVPLYAPSGHPIGALCVMDRVSHQTFSVQDSERLREFALLVTDKLELRRLEAAEQMWPTRFYEVAAASPGTLLEFDQNFHVTFCNGATAALLGYTQQQLAGAPLARFLPGLERPRLEHLIAGSTLNGSNGHLPHKALALHRDGYTVPVELVFFAWKKMSHRHFGVMLTDITDGRQRDQQLYRLSNFDALTGLANRRVLRHEVAGALDEGADVAVLAIDLDNFKDVNDTLGHKIGDQVLCVLTERMKDLLGPSEKVGRMGGDEFALLLRRGELAAARAAALSLMSEIGKPIEAGGLCMRVTASCGIALSTEAKHSAEELMGNADLALYQAKSMGRNQVSVYIPALRQEAIERRQFEAELHRAVENQEFELFYQPQVCLKSGSLIGAEALIRWNHPQKGYLSPAAFLPLLESGPLAGDVGTWVLRQACSQAAAWRQSSGNDSFRMGINLFAAQFFAGDLEEKVESALQDNGLPPESVELEITENIILNHNALILETLRRLRESGVCIAFDDFGTGYASLSMLRDYPLTQIKIDRSFTNNMCCSIRDEATVAATVGLARNYDLDVIAEGVETEEQMARLKSIGCDEGQGYFFGKPLPAEDFRQKFLVH